MVNHYYISVQLFLDKSPKQTAREEVEEETGYKVDIE